MKKNMTRLLALAFTTSAIILGTTAAQATLIGDTIYGCAAQSISGATPIAQLQNCAAGNLFIQGNTGVVVGGGTEFTGGTTKLGIAVDFSANGFALTFTNLGTSALAIPAGGGLMFANLDFQDGTYLDSVANLGGTLNGAALTPAQLASLVVNAGSNNGQIAGEAIQGGFLEINLPTVSIAVGKTATLTGTFVTVPAPGSLALLGVVLLVLGLIRIERVRLFSFRSMGQKLAS